jgi:3',5'-cyclic AMP phosphodiesterase CpdA
MEQIIKTVVEVGLPEPVRILHVTDVHLTAFDDTDPEDQQALLTRRHESFRKSGGYPPLETEEYLREAIALAEREGALLIVTGDAIDLHSSGNVALLRSIFEGHDLMFSPGGHEYQRICRRTMEEEGNYAAEMHQKLASEFPEFDLDFESRIVGGVNIITANNSMDYYNAYTVERFEAELARGYPVIVFSHDPINDKLMGLTEPYHPNVKLNAEDYAVSNRMRDAILHDPRVITTFSGHWHRHEDAPVEGKMHYVTPGLFKGICRLIEIR